MDVSLGIDTRGYFRPEELHSSECLEYTPVSYKAAKRLLDSVPVSPDDVFVDYGCGKGRIVVLASGYRYKQVVGVEISPPLCRDAERNLRLTRLKRRCGNVQVLPMDATAYQVPNDATALFFGNPFSGEILRTVVSNVRSSYLRKPRKISFLVFNNGSFIETNGAQSWITPIYKESAYPNASACLFETY